MIQGVRNGDMGEEVGGEVGGCRSRRSSERPLEGCGALRPNTRRTLMVNTSGGGGVSGPGCTRKRGIQAGQMTHLEREREWGWRDWM